MFSEIFCGPNCAGRVSLCACVLQRWSRGQILGFTSRDLTGHELHRSQMTQLHIIVDWSGCRRWTFLWLRLLFALLGLRLIQSSGAALKRMPLERLTECD